MRHRRRSHFALAWTFGIIFQYFSIVSFQVGLFAFIALYHLVLWQPPLTTASPTDWLHDAIGMIVGYFGSWPVNVWLIRRA